MPETSTAMSIYRVTVWFPECSALCHDCLRRVLF